MLRPKRLIPGDTSQVFGNDAATGKDLTGAGRSLARE
jgi:hypothetical protein